jgi:uncharacterized membrane protein YedE/YeeE
MRAPFLLFGALFGFVLSRSGATTYDFYSGLFLFTDLQLFWVIAVAASLGAVGVAALKRLGTKALLTDEPIQFEPKPWHPGIVSGSLMFGAGWGLAGACPGTVLAMAGEGKVTALFTIAGILIGTWLYGVRTDAVQTVRAASVSAE